MSDKPEAGDTMEYEARLRRALKDRYTLKRRLGAGGMALTAVRRYGGMAERGFDD